MKVLWTIILINVVLIIAPDCLSEGISVSKTPLTMPSNLGLGQYSPMLELSYSGLTNSPYTLRVWLLATNGGSWPCASSQWCESVYTIDNTSGLNSNGILRIIKNMDVYAYSGLAWIIRLYKGSTQVAWQEYNFSGVSNRPPVLSYIGQKNCLVGDKIEFYTTATDPENNSITFDATNLPSGATFQNGHFLWYPSIEGTYKVYVHANDQQTYDSQEVLIEVGPMPEIVFEQLYIPDCGSTQNITGIISGIENFTNLRAICYIFISGYGWITKPTALGQKTPINSNGSFTIDITTGGIDPLATLVYVGICNESTEVPILIGASEVPSNFPVYLSQKIKRDPTKCHRTIEWSGYEWYTKNSYGGEIGPGLNVFNGEESNVSVDSNDFLHLKINYNSLTGFFECSEIISTKSFGYGLYEFEIEKVNNLDPNTVLGLFTWEDDATPQNNREIDIEVSQGGDFYNQNLQYVIQPWQDQNNIYRFNMPLNEHSSMHRFLWKEDILYFQSYYENYPWQTKESIIEDWKYEGIYIPKKGNENIRLNLWIADYETLPLSQNQEVVIKSFNFICLEDIPGDINQDCSVDFIDLSILGENWLETIEN